MTTTGWTRERLALVLLPTALLVFLAISVADVARAQQLFVATTYYFLMALLLCWARTYAHAARDLRREAVVAWFKETGQVS